MSDVRVAAAGAGRAESSEPDAARLFEKEAIYQELRRLAGHLFRDERPGQTLQATALVNEVYMRLKGQGSIRVHNRPEFFAIAGRQMRQILVDHARCRTAAKRGGNGPKVSYLDSPSGAPGPEDLLALNDVMEELAGADAEMARIVELRYFVGMSVEETADALEISGRTVKRKWGQARTLLQWRVVGISR